MLEIKLIKLDNILTTNDNINQFDTSFDTYKQCVETLGGMTLFLRYSVQSHAH